MTPPTLASLDESEQCRMLLELIRESWDLLDGAEGMLAMPAPIWEKRKDELQERLAALGLGGGE